MMHEILRILGVALVILGGILLVIAAWGLHVLPDALSRQHAATKATTLAISTICVGAFVLEGHWSWGWRLGIIIAHLILTLSVASHMLARAAVAQLDDQQQPD